jgi:hypothetical protein
LKGNISPQARHRFTPLTLLHDQVLAGNAITCRVPILAALLGHKYSEIEFIDTTKVAGCGSMVWGFGEAELL